MLCLKCGNEIKDNEQICSHCGYNKDTISKTDNPFGVRNQGIYNANPVDKEAVEERLEHQKQFQELVEIYIGPKSYNFQKGSFSWCAFFLGPIYFMYRKLYGVGIIVYIINAIIQGFANLTNMNIYINLGITLVVQLFLGITFKKFYYNECIERIAIIKKKNPDLGFNQLTELVKRKGGVNILFAILAAIPIVLVLTIVLIAVAIPLIDALAGL